MARGEETVAIVAAMMCFAVPQSRDRLEGVERMNIEKVPDRLSGRSGPQVELVS